MMGEQLTTKVTLRFRLFWLLTAALLMGIALGFSYPRDGPFTPEGSFQTSPQEVNSCADCHRALGGFQETTVNEWESSVHAPSVATCASCHGGDPQAQDLAIAMSPEAGFIGAPAKADIPQLCGSCHADVVLMRQYTLPTDQLAKYRESQHGKLLARGDTNVATCFDCHGGHAIKEPLDPSSPVFPTNVPLTCARCHSDPLLMQPYAIPTNQFELFEKSVHGVALLERNDRRAPNCATCHGTHGATPPGLTEIQNVCGNCHALTQDYLLESPHARAVPEAPVCATCHGQHDVIKPAEDLFLGSEPRHCGSCHAPGTPAQATAVALYEAISDAAMAFDLAEDAVAHAEENRMTVVREEEQLLDIATSLIEARAIQHTISLERVQDKTDEVQALSDQVHEAAEEAVDEARFRRQAMVIAVIAILLTVAALVMVKRAIDRRRQF